jgi:DNA polymerase-1
MPVLVSEIQESLNAWKATYQNAWAYLSARQDDVARQGYVEGAWGRRRQFPKTDDEGLLMAFQRQSANHPIQNTVSDTMRIAMHRVMVERDRQHLRSRIANQIHDALLVRVPNDEVERMTEILRTKMGGIPIPLPSGETLMLEVDIEYFTRWGEKTKKVA